MNSSRQTEILIYLGTQKIVMLEAVFGQGDPSVVRHVIQKNPDGFEMGMVSNLEKAAATLESLRQKLTEGTVGPETSPYVILGNSKLKTYTFSSSQYYQGFQRTITPQEIRSVVNQTRSVATLPLSEFVLQSIPDCFVVNDLEGVSNPLGLEAHRLGVQLKIHTMNFQEFKNIARAFEAAEISVTGYFPKTLTSPEGIFTEEEREEGAVLIDIADDTLNFILWKDGYLVDNRTADLGGKYLTRRIASEWAIDHRDAQKVKEQFASLVEDKHFGEELIPLIERNGQGNQQVHRQAFQQRILSFAEDWMKEILNQADAFAQDRRVLHPNLVFTGGGTSIDGFIEFLQRRFNRTCRIGLTRKVKAPNELLVDPSLTGALGMLRWIDQHAMENSRLLAPQGFLQKTLASARDWFTTYF